MRPTSGAWYYRHDGETLQGIAAKLGLDEQEIVRRIVHTYLATNADLVSALRTAGSVSEAEEAMEVTISANVDLFHELLEETDDLLIRLDDAGLLTYVNPAAAALLGTDVLQGVGRRAIELVHPEDRTATLETYREAIARRRPRVRYENRVIGPDGQVRYLSWNATLHYDVAGRMVSVTAIARDLTERHELQALHDRNQQALLSLLKQRAFTGGDLNASLKAIAEASAETLGVERVSIWLYRDDDTRIECLDLYERTAKMHTQGGELLSRDAPSYFQALEQDRVIAADDARRDPHTAQLASYLEAHGIGAMLDAPIHIGGKTAGVICHEHVGDPRAWSLEDQNFAASLGDMVSIVFEQAERRRAELEILRQTVALEKAQELNRMMGDFVNLVAHELRTPLTSVLGFVELMEENLPPEHQASQQPYLNQIRLGFSRLSRLIDDLLDFARLEAGSFKLDVYPTDLAAKIREAVESLTPQALDARIKLEIDLPDAPLEVPMDASRIGQVLLNLVGNAIKYTGAGGRVIVRAREAGERVRVEVSDTGSAIPPEDLPKLFTKFSRLAGGHRKNGVGLGLYISKSLVEAHGGTIGAESELHKGSTFWFTLPITPPEESGAAAL